MKKSYPKTVRNLIDACSEALYARIDENWTNSDWKEIEVETKDGSIYVTVTPEDTEVFVSHKNETELECSLLCERIKNELPTREDLEDAYIGWCHDMELNSDGLDPAFHSWAEVNAQFFNC